MSSFPGSLSSGNNTDLTRNHKKPKKLLTLVWEKNVCQGQISLAHQSSLVEFFKKNPVSHYEQIFPRKQGGNPLKAKDNAIYKTRSQQNNYHSNIFFQVVAIAVFSFLISPKKKTKQICLEDFILVTSCHEFRLMVID